MDTEYERKAQFFSDNCTRCSCGHTMLITSKDGKVLCPYCKKYVFVNKEAEIRYRNREALIKAKREISKNG